MHYYPPSTLNAFIYYIFRYLYLGNKNLHSVHGGISGERQLSTQRLLAPWVVLKLKHLGGRTSPTCKKREWGRRDVVLGVLSNKMGNEDNFYNWHLGFQFTWLVIPVLDKGGATVYGALYG